MKQVTDLRNIDALHQRLAARRANSYDNATETALPESELELRTIRPHPGNCTFLPGHADHTCQHAIPPTVAESEGLRKSCARGSRSPRGGVESTKTCRLTD